MKPRPLGLVPPPVQTPDARAFARIAAGDISALGEIYDRHVAALLVFAERVVGSDDARDVVQSTFLRASRIAVKYQSRDSTARPWLYGIMMRLVRERRRSLIRLARALVRFNDVPRPPVQPVGSGRHDLERAIARLSGPKRIVLLLADVEGYTCEEIARIVEAPVGTVWTRLHHARREMREMWKGGDS